MLSRGRTPRNTPVGYSRGKSATCKRELSWSQHKSRMMLSRHLRPLQSRRPQRPRQQSPREVPCFRKGQKEPKKRGSYGTGGGRERVIPNSKLRFLDPVGVHVFFPRARAPLERPQSVERHRPKTGELKSAGGKAKVEAFLTDPNVAGPSGWGDGAGWVCGVRWTNKAKS